MPNTDIGALPFVPVGVPPADIRAIQTAAAEWTVSWAKGTMQGYYLYVGASAPGVYSSRVDVGRATSYVLRNLPASMPHYVAVSAYNADGDESLTSDPLSLPDTPPETNRSFMPLIVR